jgi:hypothetical protein
MELDFTDVQLTLPSGRIAAACEVEQSDARVSVDRGDQEAQYLLGRGGT